MSHYGLGPMVPWCMQKEYIDGWSNVSDFELRGLAWSLNHIPNQPYVIVLEPEEQRETIQPRPPSLPRKTGKSKKKKKKTRRKRR